MSDPQGTDLAEFFRVGHDALRFFRGMRDLLPQGEQQDKAQEKIEDIERALRLAEAEIGKAFGYRMCQCTLPPTPMLYKHAEGLYICGNSECGRTQKSAERLMQEQKERRGQRSTWTARGGRNDWRR